jgi:lipopolysaccharide biosynthesis regulator YciM
MNIATSNDVYFKLLALYVKENDVDGVLSIYLALYEHDRNSKYLEKIIKAYAFKGDIDGAIAFLEKNQVGLKTLYQLYKSRKDFDKALKLAQRLHKEENDPRWLAEIAILTYEQAKDKNDQKMIEKVVKTFDKALAQGVDDSVYLNYYGYTLIDKDIDVKKGMQILKDALNQQPDNTYYLDSLAWGYYKEGECKRAYELMEKVVAQEGLKEPEIAEHWDAIRKCK